MQAFLFFKSLGSYCGLYIVDPFGEIVLTLGEQEAGVINRMEWFPDGRRIAGAVPYRPARATNDQNRLKIMNIESKSIRTYINPVIPADNLKISPDGKYIVATGVLYEGSRITDYASPYLFEVATEKLMKLPGFNATGFGWSPDSSKLAYSAQTTNNPNGLRDKILIVNPDGTIQKSLQGMGYRKLSVGWSPHPEWILFKSEEQTSFVPASFKTTSMYVMNIVSGEQYKLPNTWTEDTWNIKKCNVCI